MKKSTTIPLTPLQNQGRYLPASKRRYHMMAKPSGFRLQPGLSILFLSA